jgi:hypothetical protein
LVIAFKLTKAGLWPDPESVLSARVDLVLAGFDYYRFLNDYEIADYILNKD